MSGTDLETVFEAWWTGLQEDRSGRADLRRCGTVLEVQLLPVFFRLARRLPASMDHGRAEWLAAAAAALSHVREDAADHSFPKLLSAGPEGHPVLSDLRFRRLLASERPEELMLAVRRAVQLTRGRAPVGTLGRDLLRWGDPVRKRWAHGYYADSED